MLRHRAERHRWPHDHSARAAPRDEGDRRATFDRITQPHGYTVENMHAITVPALILTGDRDPFCTVEAGAAAYRALPAGELAVLPDTGHLITPAAVQAMIEFFERL
jgi:pimeloyl-ACP methyl ester carboxylesterase